MSDIDTPTQRLHDVLKGFSSAMLVTMEPSGDHRARPMAVAELRDTSVTFITRMDSPKVDELSNEPKVCITFQGSSTYASVSGIARVSRDRVRIDTLWSPAWKTWFPNGKDDPQIVLIDVDPSEGEYWDNAGTNGVKYMFRAAVALAKGETPKVDRDQHGKVNL